VTPTQYGKVKRTGKEPKGSVATPTTVEEVEKRGTADGERGPGRQRGTEGEENENVATELQSAFDEVPADEEARTKNRSRCKRLMKNISPPRGRSRGRRKSTSKRKSGSENDGEGGTTCSSSSDSGASSSEDDRPNKRGRRGGAAGANERENSTAPLESKTKEQNNAGKTSGKDRDKRKPTHCSMHRTSRNRWR
jgi:hypothetical protein